MSVVGGTFEDHQAFPKLKRLKQPLGRGLKGWMQFSRAWLKCRKIPKADTPVLVHILGPRGLKAGPSYRTGEARRCRREDQVPGRGGLSLEWFLTP